jgi:tetratricopeptide (TPR) repeat protein
VARLAPRDGAAGERVGRLRLRLSDRDAARAAFQRARTTGPSVEGLLDLALLHHLAGEVGATVSVCEEATRLDPGSAAAWSRLAHALARTDRLSEGIAACERALALEPDEEVSELLERLREAQPAELGQRTAA